MFWNPLPDVLIVRCPPAKAGFPVVLFTSPHGHETSVGSLPRDASQRVVVAPARAATDETAIDSNSARVTWNGSDLEEVIVHLSGQR
jgi:hypothetical protein